MTIWLWIVGVTAVVWPIVCGFWFYADLQARLLSIAHAADAQINAGHRRSNDLAERVTKLEDRIADLEHARRPDTRWA